MAKTEKTINEKNGSFQFTKLQNELIKLIKDIDEEGILFLIEQANVIKYNMQVDMINKEKQKLMSESKKVSGDSTDNSTYTDIEIIPGEENKNFIVRLGTARKFLSRPDFKSIVTIAQSQDGIGDTAKRLFRWLEKERKDFLIDCNIRNAANPLLIEFIKVIKSKYKVK